MLALLVFPLMAGCCTLPAAPEPDGSRTLGIIPPFRGEPAPPDWLRAASHLLLARGAGYARHYLYEAYADGCGGWLVHYRQFPAAGEAVPETQLAFLFGSDALGEPLGEPLALRTGEVRYESRNARWQGRAFVLVDRRDLVRPSKTRRPPGSAGVAVEV
jgi:hypothetical protein